MIGELKIPKYAAALLGRVIIDGYEDVPGFEAVKAPDVKFLFENKLIAFQRSDDHVLAVRIVLTNKGNEIKESVLKSLIGNNFQDLLELIQEQ